MKNILRNNHKYIFNLILFLSAFAFMQCGKEPQAILYDDPKYNGAANPVVNNVVPKDSAWTVIDTISINGNNFSNKIEENFVYFNNIKGNIISASSTLLKVITPDYPKDSITIKVIVQNAEKYAEVKNYKLGEAIGTFYPFKTEQQPYTGTFDKNGNFYVSLVVNGVGSGIKKIDAAKNITDYAPKGGETFWYSIKFGNAGSQLYGVRGVKAIFKINPGQTPSAWVTSAAGLNDDIYDFDFDQSGKMWAAGSGNNVYYVNPTSPNPVTPFPFSASIKSVRVFGNYFYVGGKYNNKEGVWRFPINGTTLGSVENYFELLSISDSSSVQAITFDAAGNLYIGTNGKYPILVVKVNKSASYLYPGSLLPKAQYFAWGEGKYILYTKVPEDTRIDPNQTIRRVFTFNNSAPYYGLQF